MIYELLSIPHTDVALRTKWYVRIRWFVLMAITIPGVASLYIGQGWSAEVQRDLLLALTAVGSNGIFYFLARRGRSERYYRLIAIVILSIDILFVTYLIMSKGGVESRSVILYVIPILMSAAILGRSATYKVTGAAILLYDSLIIADYFNIINSFGAYNPELRSQSAVVVNTIFFFSAILFIIGALANFIISLLAEKELQASRSVAALGRAQSIANMGSWEWDIVADKVSWSQQLYKIYNAKPAIAPLTFDTYLKRIHPEDKERVRSIIEDSLKTAKAFQLDHRIVTKGSTIRYLHAEGRVQVDSLKRPTRMYGTAQDITAKREFENAKHEFVSLASHQLRTPATGVKAFLSLLSNGYAGDLSEQQKEYLETAYEANERQLHIIDDLLNTASIESGKIVLNKRPIDIGLVIGTSIEVHSSLLKSKKQSLEVRVPKRPVYAELDIERFRMVLDNLLSNASKYTPKGGVITVKLCRLKGRVAVMVRDTGIGIATSDQRELFQKFYRISNSKTINVEGSGLGLYLVKQLVELHGGELKVSSRLGRGSTFTIYLSETKILQGATPRLILPARKHKYNLQRSYKSVAKS